MCGILGLIGCRRLDDVATVRVMRDTMRHRGPDDAGCWQSGDGKVVLAHRRLAILDLSANGRQPMTDATGTLQIVFNGEIYNHEDLRRQLQAEGHTFRTKTDTECILYAFKQWGSECLSRLVGMFAFAIVDTTSREVFIARDRAGEKPLFYYAAKDLFLFASELKALMAYPGLPRVLDLSALRHYLSYGYVPGDMCILKDVRKLPPAHAMTLKVDSLSCHVWRYWDLPVPGNASASEADLVDELESLLNDSVRRQLFADVAVGIMLSGGLDSSLVTAAAARAASGTVKTFTITFPGHPRHDEARHARLIARHFGTEHIELPADSLTWELLPSLARQFDEPMCDSSMIPTYMISKVIRSSATVALGGDGGDELFGGYRAYQRTLWQRVLCRCLPSVARRATSALADRLVPLGCKGRKYVMALAATTSATMLLNTMHFDETWRDRLLQPAGLLDGPRRDPLQYGLLQCDSTRGLPGAQMALDFRMYLPEDILTKVDRASMLASLEVRSPFLDHRIVEFAFGKVPSRWNVTLTARKRMLRCLGRKVLPREFQYNRKQGFSLPLKAWLRGAWKNRVTEVLLDGDASLFDQAVIRTLLRNSGKPYFSNTELVFSLVLFELWRREYGIAVPRS